MSFMMSNVASKQAFHIVFTGTTNKDGEAVIKICPRRPFNPSLVYDPDYHFMAHETSQLLDLLLSTTYGWVTLEAVGREAKRKAAKWAKKAIRKGITDAQTGIRYRVIYGDFSSDKGKLLCVPVASNLRSLADIGLYVSDDPKAAKRTRRAMATHMGMLKAQVVAREEVPQGMQYLVELETGLRFTVLHHQMSGWSDEAISFVDGMNIFNLAANGTKITVVDDLGIIKGFGHNNPLVQHAIVGYGTKTEFKVVGDTMYIGVLGELHEHDAYEDIQSFCNFGHYESGLAIVQGQDWMDEVWRVLESDTSDDKIVDTFSVFAHLNEQRMFGEDEDGNPVPKPEAHEWALVHAMRLDVGIKSMPVLYRRVFQHMFENSIDLTRGRIPFMKVAKRLNVAPNPLCFNENGDVNLELDVLGDNVCSPDLPAGKLLVYRNPNTHSKECVIVNNVHIPQLRKYRSKGLLFFGRGAGKHLSKLNGGDMDDSVIAIHDPRYIAKAESLDYPVEPKLEYTDGGERKLMEDNNPYLAKARSKYLRRNGEWNLLVLEQQINRWTQYEVGLGTFINRILLDLMLSGEQKLSIKWDLACRMQAEGLSEEDREQLEKAYAFISARKDFMLRREASNSDLVIDWLQMRKGDKKLVDSLIEHSETVLDTPIYPVSYEGRIPPELRGKGGYLLVKTLACRALDKLMVQRDHIIEASRQMEWMLRRPIPEAVDQMFEAYDAITEMVHEMRTWWREQWELARLTKTLDDTTYEKLANGWTEIVELGPEDEGYDPSKPDEEQIKVLKHIGLRDKYMIDDEGKPFSKETRLTMAVEFYRQVYSKTDDPQVGEDGFTMSVGDGLPDFILNDFLTALEETPNLCGLRVFVQLNTKGGYWVKHHETEPVEVTVIAGRVYRHEDKEQLSDDHYPALPDGNYQMSPQGVIRVAAAAGVLHSAYKAVESMQLAKGELLSRESALTF